jgi:hypothetical protein
MNTSWGLTSLMTALAGAKLWWGFIDVLAQRIHFSRMVSPRLAELCRNCNDSVLSDLCTPGCCRKALSATTSLSGQLGRMVGRLPGGVSATKPMAFVIRHRSALLPEPG